MNITKKIGKDVTVKYAKLERPISDSEIELYGAYKISVLLTDGLAGIVGGQIFSGERYDLFAFRPDEIHFGRFLRSGTHEYIDFYIAAEYFNQFSEAEALRFFLDDRTPDRSNLLVPDNESREIIRDLSRRTVSLLEHGGEFCETELLSITLQVVLLCSKLYRIPKGQHRQTAPPIVSRTLAYIDTHFEKKLTVQEIAHIMGCSETYLSRTFKRYAGVSVYQHITAVRIRYAKKMLSQGASVTDACFSCGFNDCSNFIRSFQETVGETPLKYKKHFFE